VVVRAHAASGAEDVDEGWSLFVGGVLHWFCGWEACVRPVARARRRCAGGSSTITSLGPVCESGCGRACLCSRTVAGVREPAVREPGSGNGTAGVATTCRLTGVYVGDRKSWRAIHLDPLRSRRSRLVTQVLYCSPTGLTSFAISQWWSQRRTWSVAVAACALAICTGISRRCACVSPCVMWQATHDRSLSVDWKWKWGGMVVLGFEG